MSTSPANITEAHRCRRKWSDEVGSFTGSTAAVPEVLDDVEALLIQAPKEA